MALTFTSLTDLLSHGYDSLIDVRSPAEYAEDHIAGAVNMPVLSDEERATVGTIYVQQSPFLARKIGAAMIFRNAAAHVEGPLAVNGGGWRPLVYCWRGGQRSGSFSYLLKEIGWRSDTISGGYQSYRRLVYQALYDGTLSQRVVLLDGYTGTAKTDLLPLLAARGVQVIDLEGLANHRGSLLGSRPGGQPPQKAFESALAGQLQALDPDRPLVLEAESSKIGNLLIPPALWKLMKAAPRIEVTAPLAARADYLVAAYEDLWTDPARLKKKLVALVGTRGRETVNGWIAKLEQQDMTGLAAALMAQHYDPSYAKSRRSIGAETVAQIHAESLDPPGLETTADALARALAAL
ncbi:tRNA 2-selenouridine(34) synthase MnmH [Roseisalinus antarcticus]|uniref:tRNA 2-selenouridine synthase n=1 Tax=Roseisalinus antarcticus TaxID=254357 RepID=A0A1Y5SA70_9RHOB|nr:tRNA 2-selenouridine(34) synthase MnmH [Roseisalinus antarcticus]SLN33501.1 tRNA 2-selenouridine synthase [Roseisalinus antarcticus]